MIQTLLALCCVLGCPLVMAGTMLFMGRDRRSTKMEREVRRLNREATRRTAARDQANFRPRKDADGRG